jgi:hypothetical protein
MTNILWRVALVGGGAFLLVANSMGGGEGTLLGFYPPATAEMIGFDISKIAIAALALWFIYRGIRPRRVTLPPVPPNTKA